MFNIYVKNLHSARTGKAVSNQFIIYNPQNCSIIFQSYNTQIAKRCGNKIIVNYNFNYSRTAAKYFRKFIEESTSYFCGLADADAIIAECKKFFKNGRTDKNIVIFLDREGNILEISEEENT